MLNYDYLNEITGGDVEFIAELLSDFLAQTPELIAQIAAAVAQGDADSLGKAAHALKGSARAIGADEFAQLAFELEQAGKQGNLTDAPNALQRLQAYWQSLAEYLQQQRAA
ncbi:MAG: Hpt domain-containing protein [Fimbriimonadales bacterium]|nr:Hpt domain-containing protein [Fimbriimonadales bacterium]